MFYDEHYIFSNITEERGMKLVYVHKKLMPTKR